MLLRPVSWSLKIAVLGLPFVIAGCDRQSADPAQPKAAGASGSPVASAAPLTGVIDRSHHGATMPDFTLRDPSGKELRLLDLKGKPVLINLWATWCAPCVAEMPTLERLATDKADSLKVLTVSQDMGAPDKVTTFFAKQGLVALEPWLDTNGDLPMHYQAQTLPTSVLYDAEGREVWRFVGGHDWTAADTAKMLAEAGI